MKKSETKDNLSKNPLFGSYLPNLKKMKKLKTLNISNLDTDKNSDEILLNLFDGFYLEDIDINTNNIHDETGAKLIRIFNKC